jgi:hypothetical protein
MNLGISAIEYVLPSTSLSLKELAAFSIGPPAPRKADISTLHKPGAP